jgi:hypothetical protein
MLGDAAQRHVAAAHHPELVGRLGETGEIAEIDLRDGRRDMALERCEEWSSASAGTLTPACLRLATSPLS